MKTRGKVPWKLCIETRKLLLHAASITTRAGLTNISAALAKRADDWHQVIEAGKSFPASEKIEKDER